jgi:Gpi18-like mannosyltransferase
MIEVETKAGLLRKYAALYVLLFCSLLLLVVNTREHGDVDYWRNWAGYIAEHGLGNAYQNEVNNYNPLFHYVLQGYVWVLKRPEKIQYYIHFLPSFTLLFDFAGAILAAFYFARGNYTQRFLASLLLLFNGAYLYNTLGWEQVDAIFTCFVFVATLLALRQHVVASMVCFVLAVNFKSQSVIFLPPLLLLWVPLWRQSVRALGLGLGMAVGLQVAILAPFIWGGNQNDIGRVLDVAANSVDFYPYVSMNAYNFWALLGFPMGMEVSDTIEFSGLSYKRWGLLLFCLSSAVVLLPLLLAAVPHLRARRTFGPADNAVVLLTMALIPVVFCYFNTQMHERYWHPCLLFLAAYGFVVRRYWLYVVASVAYFLNMEAVTKRLQLLKYGMVLFDPRFGAVLFTTVLVGGLVQLYSRAAIRSQVRELLTPAAKPEWQPEA